MADEYKRLGAIAPTDSLEHVLYTAPAGKTALISNITVVNRGDSAEIFDVNVYPSGALEGTVSNSTDKNILMLGASVSFDGGTTWTSSSGSTSRFDMATNGAYVVGVGSSYYSYRSTDGAVWSQHPLPVSTSSWRGAAYGAGVFVTIVNGLAAGAVSTDGINWTATILPSAVAWDNVLFGSGVFLALTGGATYATSTNGVTWTSRSNAQFNSGMYGAVYADGYFLLSPNGVTPYKSTDGVTWTGIANLPSSANWQYLAYGNGRHLALPATNTTGVVYSTNGGTSWISTTMPVSASWYGLAFSYGYFYAIPVNSTTGYRSTDGITWTSILNTMGFQNYLSSVTLPYVSSGEALHKQATILAKTTEVLEPGAILNEGQTLVVRGTPSTSISAYGVEVSDTGIYKVLGQVRGSWDGALAYTVPSGKQALIRSIVSSNESAANSYAGVSFGDKSSQARTSLVAMATYTGKQPTAVSSDGITWSATTSELFGPGVGSTSMWSKIASGPDKFVAISGYGYAAVSGDGKYWTISAVYLGKTTSSSIAYGNGVFVATGASILRTSTDGITWSSTNYAPTGGNIRVAFGGGIFALVRDGSTYGATSTDGVTWTQVTTAFSSSWAGGIAYGAGKFVAVANFSSSMYSTNGVTWAYTGLSSAQFKDISFGGGLFLVVGNGSTAYTSTDGITWTSRSLPISGNFMSCACAGGKFIVGGITATAPYTFISAFSTDGTTWVSTTIPYSGVVDSQSGWGAMGAISNTLPLPSKEQYVSYEVPMQGYETITTKAGYALEQNTPIYAVSPSSVVTTIFGLEIDLV